MNNRISPFAILGMLMTLIYLGGAFVLFFSKNLGLPIQQEFQRIFAAILLMYGLYRGWKVYHTYFREDRY